MQGIKIVYVTAEKEIEEKWSHRKALCDLKRVERSEKGTLGASM
jgi:hypothetical protein